MVMAHRYIMNFPNGMVCHTCDTPACVNPDHLYVGNQEQNMLDRSTRNRQAKGEANGGGQKLTEQDVIEIRSKWNTQRGTRQRLAEEYGVNPTMIINIVEGKRWTHLIGIEMNKEYCDASEKRIAAADGLHNSTTSG